MNTLLMQLIFIIVLILIIKPPKRIPIYLSTLIGALLTFIVGMCQAPDLYKILNISWDAILTLIGLMIISINLKENLFFEFIANKIILYSNFSIHLLFLAIVLLTSFVSLILANDGAILIMTPLTLNIIKQLNFDKKTSLAFLFTVGFLCDGASIGLLASNLTNILLADTFQINYIEYAKNMLFKTGIVILVAYIIYLITFKDVLTKSFTISIKNVTKFTRNSIIVSSSLLLFLIFTFLVSSFAHFPASICVMTTAILISLYNLKNKFINVTNIIANIDWTIIIFANSLFIIIVGLYNSHSLNFIDKLFMYNSNSLLYYAKFELIFSIISSVFNNLPACLISIICLKHVNLSHELLNNLINLTLIATNIGSKLLPFGSLATLLWLDIIKQNGFGITWKVYLKYTLPVTITCLLVLIIFK